MASPDADLPAPRSGAAGISSGGVAALAGASVAPADAPATYSENGRDRPARQAPALRVSWSEEPSRRARMLARFVRVFVRPWLVSAAWISGIGIKFGPRGIEMWPVWEMMLRVTDWIGWFLPAPRGTQIERVRLEHCRAEWVRASGVRPGGRVILYFHGGGYVGAGLSTHRRLVAKLSAAADASVLNIAYRMLPRWAVNYAIEDGVAGYRKLLQDGVAPERILFGGDSAGGGLVFLVALAARTLGLPQPAGIVAISPWADFDMESKLEYPNARSDPFIPTSGMRFVVDQLICKGEPLDPELSPVHADLSGLPPTLIHVGTTEVLECDAVKLSESLAAAGVPVHRKHWRGQIHDFQIAADLLPEARQAIREIGEFARASARIGR